MVEKFLWGLISQKNKSGKWFCFGKIPSRFSYEGKHDTNLIISCLWRFEL